MGIDNIELLIPEVPQKKSKIRIPMKKIVEAGQEFFDDLLPPEGTAFGTISLYEDDESFTKNEMVLLVEGDRHIVENITHKVMTLIRS